MKEKYSVSIDLDWAPDPVLDYTLNLLAKHGVSATFFMTNKTTCDMKGHELAIHPNFTSLDFEKHLLERLEEYPNAKGTRSHSLFFTERLRPFYEKHKLVYQSNAMMYMQKDIKPFMMSPTTLELPFYFMDTFYIIMNKNVPAFEPNELNLDSEGLKIFDFHPVHIFLNTETLSRYESVKKHYKEPKELVKARNTGSRGVKDIFEDVLQFCKSSGRAATLEQIHAAYKQSP
jgi:hypothetical protein